jgi:hypothetical protein
VSGITVGGSFLLCFLSRLFSAAALTFIPKVLLSLLTLLSIEVLKLSSRYA